MFVKDVMVKPGVFARKTCNLLHPEGNRVKSSDLERKGRAPGKCKEPAGYPSLGIVGGTASELLQTVRTKQVAVGFSGEAGRQRLQR